MKRTLIASVGVLTVIALAGLALGAKSMAGKKAPGFTLKDLHGKSYSLKDYKGKIVVLEWANKDCPVWRGRLKALNDTYKKYVDKGVVWLNIDSTHNAKTEPSHVFMVKNDVTKPVLSDPDGKVGRAYDARTTPHMFIIDKTGNIAYDGAADNQGKGTDFVDYVAQALDELTAGKSVSTPATNPYGCSVKYKKK